MGSMSDVDILVDEYQTRTTDDLMHLWAHGEDPVERLAARTVALRRLEQAAPVHEPWMP